LASGNETGLRSVVEMAPSQPLDAGVAQQLAALGPITFDVASFHDNADGTATVTAHLAHPPTGGKTTWLVQLVDSAGRWRISLTEPVS
jgi:hypothetical protein